MAYSEMKYRDAVFHARTNVRAVAKLCDSRNAGCSKETPRKLEGPSTSKIYRNIEGAFPRPGDVTLNYVTVILNKMVTSGVWKLC